MNTWNKFAQKTKALNENYKNSDSYTSDLQNGNSNGFVEYVVYASEQDPNFFRWLFNEDLAQDFDFSLTEKQQEIWDEYKGLLSNSY